MRRVIVQYRVKPQSVTENVALVQAVYRELARLNPAGFRYATFRAGDGLTFVHIAFTDDGSQSPLDSLPAFGEFQQEITERCDEPPRVLELQEVGSYQMFTT